MSGNTQVLREYLLSLGFKVNTQQSKGFDKTLERTTKLATGAGTALIGAGAAAVTMVQLFANQMEKLYYASRRTGSTVQSLQALEFGAKQIGLSGETIKGAIEGMARSLRTSPGLAGMLESMGVKVTGRDTSDVMVDMVSALRKMPFYVGSKFAAMFGLDGDTFLMLSQNLDKFKEAMAKSKEIDAATGVDSNKAAEAAVEYANALGEVTKRVGVLKDALAIALLPTMRDFVGASNEFLKDVAEVAVKSHGLWDFLTRISKRVAGHADDAPALPEYKPQSNTGGGLLNDEAKATLERWADKIRDIGKPPGTSAARRAALAGNTAPAGAGAPLGGGAPIAGDRQGLMTYLEQEYGLPNGVLDALWAQESGRGTNMRSPTGVRGHFQITTPNRKRFGMTDPDDFEQGAVTAAKYMSELLKQYGGRLPNALAAWNGGTAAARDLRLGSAETQAFVPSMMKRIEQNNTFYITGADPNAIAQAVGQRLEASNADMLRNNKGTIQ